MSGRHSAGLRSLAVLCCLFFIAYQPSRVHSEEEDYYKLLGVSKTASEREIKKAFRKLAMEYHPDKNPDPESRKRFEKIANAYDILSNKDKRREYDRFGSQGTGQQGTPFDFDAFFRPGGDSGFNHHAHFNFHSMFDDFFDDKFFQNTFAGDFFQESHHQPHHHHDQHMDHNDGFFGFDLEDSYGSEDEDNVFSGGFGFGGGFGMDFQFESHTASSQGQRGQNCKTVTKRVGNTITTHTTCS